MKCINKREMRTGLCLFLTLGCILTGCGGTAYDMPYSTNSDISSFNVISGQNRRTAVPFASDLCVVTGDVTADTDADMSEMLAAILFSLEDDRVIYAKNAHEVLHPASLTKVMTALVALKYGSLDQRLTATSAVNITESGAVLCGLKAGDTMSMDQALRILLVYSANDAAMLIAENVGGSVENFIAMMNEEAKRLGATNTNFANPHGLTDANHCTTAYDLYLIFNEAMKYETFGEIIQMTGYQTVYYDKDGKEKTFDRSTTNQFLRGEYSAPANVTVIGGKTGTTKAAGHCLMLRARDVNGAPYVSVILGAPSGDRLYNGMVDLLDEINN
ncbi:MAG: serine hydrolase [Acetatifactor sp.]|nr:serine hydrolase [Acetatifactor sp.]